MRPTPFSHPSALGVTLSSVRPAMSALQGSEVLVIEEGEGKGVREGKEIRPSFDDFLLRSRSSFTVRRKAKGSNLLLTIVS